mmetsp:Transcript_40478/g.104921  ORF Transcript_40478/g.104921 Transcript_40478/m.104921 type:complete len:206 (+) Transcript_40478:1672-2289(+)
MYARKKKDQRRMLGILFFWGFVVGKTFSCFFFVVFRAPLGFQERGFFFLFSFLIEFFSFLLQFFAFAVVAPLGNPLDQQNQNQHETPHQQGMDQGGDRIGPSREPHLFLVVRDRQGEQEAGTEANDEQTGKDHQQHVGVGVSPVKALCQVKKKGKKKGSHGEQHTVCHFFFLFFSFSFSLFFFLCGGLWFRFHTFFPRVCVKVRS